MCVCVSRAYLKHLQEVFFSEFVYSHKQQEDFICWKEFNDIRSDARSFDTAGRYDECYAIIKYLNRNLFCHSQSLRRDYNQLKIISKHFSSLAARIWGDISFDVPKNYWWRVTNWCHFHFCGWQLARMSIHIFPLFDHFLYNEFGNFLFLWQKIVVSLLKLMTSCFSNSSWFFIDNFLLFFCCEPKKTSKIQNTFLINTHIWRSEHWLLLPNMNCHKNHIWIRNSHRKNT